MHYYQIIRKDRSDKFNKMTQTLQNYILILGFMPTNVGNMPKGMNRQMKNDLYRVVQLHSCILVLLQGQDGPQRNLIFKKSKDGRCRLSAPV